MEDQNLPERITATYSDLGELQVSLGRNDKAQASYKNAEQWYVTKQWYVTRVDACNFVVQSKNLTPCETFGCV